MPLQKVATTKTNDAFYDYKFQIESRDETFFVRKNRDGKWENSFDLQTFDRKRDAVNYVVDYFKTDVPVYQFNRRIKPDVMSFEERSRYYTALSPEELVNVVSYRVEDWKRNDPLVIVIDTAGNASKCVVGDGSPEMFRSIFKEGAETCAVVVPDETHAGEARRIKRLISDVQIDVVDIVNEKTKRSVF